jgi:hypothetical protein
MKAYTITKKNVKNAVKTGRPIDFEHDQNKVRCACDKGHVWYTTNPQRDTQCPICGEYWQ